MVILDTNIIIDHLRLNGDQPSLLEKLNNAQPSLDLALSLISVQELYTGHSSQHSAEEMKLLYTITPLKILAYDQSTATLAGKIVRDSKKNISFADAAIAATTIINHASLFTLNIKDFSDIPRLELFSLLR